MGEIIRTIATSLALLGFVGVCICAIVYMLKN